MKIRISVEDGSYNSMIVAEQSMSYDIKRENIEKNREKLGSLFMATATRIASDMDRDETINPIPQDKPCCEEFEKWAREMSAANMGGNAKVCPFCGKAISKERREKYLLVEKF